MTGEVAVIEGLDDLIEIGRGGFGVVYRAVERDLGRTVAIKVLPPLHDEETRRRFDRERLALGSMSGHPNIVTIHRSGSTDDGKPYLVMEFCDQGSLSDQLDTTGPLPWERATEIAVKTAGALETAHRAGIIHRDIKPANLLLSSLGEPKLADFGIARMEGTPETRSTSITASLAHAAPEILNGARPDARSDVYGLASTLYELIVGSPAFVQTGETMLSSISRIAQAPVPAVLAERAPPAVVAVIEQGMAKSATDRQPSAAAFGLALTEAQQRSGIPPIQLRLEGDPVDSGSGDFAPTRVVSPAMPLPIGPPQDNPVPISTADAPAAAGPGNGFAGPVDEVRTDRSAIPGQNGVSRLALIAVSALALGALLVAAAGYLAATSGGEELNESTAETTIDDGADTATGSGSSTTSPPEPATPVTVQADSEPLTIGTLLPMTGPLATFGPTTQAGVELAIADINAAGGVLGQEVALEVGDSADGAAEVLVSERDRLIAASVDAVVGPFTSSDSIYLVENPASEPLVMISPTATSLELSTLDTDGLYFRTSPSEATQGTVMAQILSDAGIDRLALVHIDDAYGERLSDTIRQRYAQLGGIVVVTSAYDPFGDTGPIVQELLATPADGIVIIGFNETVDIYAALTAAGIGPQGDGTPVFGVDANAMLQGDGATIDGYRAVLPKVDLRPLALFTERMLALDVDLLEEFPFAPESYDATVIAALAAEASGSSDSAEMATAIAAITKDGEKCFDYGECKRMLAEGDDIDYDGLAGPYELTEDGDPRVASYLILTYDGGDQPNPELDEYVFSR